MSDASGSEPSALHQLAEHVGIMPGYHASTGEWRDTGDETRRAILGALGIDASTDATVEAALVAVHAASKAELVPPVRVVVQGDRSLAWFDVRAPLPPAPGSWRLEVDVEGGARQVTEGHWHDDSPLSLQLPAALPLGYHRLHLTLRAGAREWVHEQTLIVVPPRCITPKDLLGDHCSFGLIANLYTLRSRSNWGVGDFSDL